MFTNKQLLMPIFLSIASFAFSETAQTNKNQDHLSQSIKGRILEKYGKLPLHFEENKGQTDKQVDFFSRGNGYTIFLTPTEAMLTLRQIKTDVKQKISDKIKSIEQKKAHTTKIRIKLLGTNPNTPINGLEELPGKSNYFIGKDPTEWRRNITHYGKVRYKEVYPGIDLVFYGNQRKLEYDFVVEPGADPNAISLAFKGTEKLTLDEQGNLILHTGDGRIIQHAPRVYQELNGNRQGIGASYILKDKNRVSFQIASYDPHRDLVIDPVLSYSTYLGGNEFDSGLGIAVDLKGNAYVTGDTGSTNFPIQDPLQPAPAGSGDAFVTKLNRKGDAIVYSTYLGGSEFDFGSGIAVDFKGNAYVIGNTASTDFPIQNAVQPSFGGGIEDAFVVKLSRKGDAIVYSTYLGGSDSERSRGIALDFKRNVYVTGFTRSNDFPIQSPFQSNFGGGDNDVFVTKINRTGDAIVYSTYLGGSKFDSGAGIAVDFKGNAYITGNTVSTDFPIQNAVQQNLGSVGNSDAFVTKLSRDGNALVYSTYLGGNGFDDGKGIAVDFKGRAFVTGRASSDFPIQDAFQPTHGGFGDAFVTKLNREGNALIYSTYLGGNNTDFGSSIALDLKGNVYVTGGTTSTDFPIQDALQSTLAGNEDAFVTKLSRHGDALVYSTYLGGSPDRIEGDEGEAIAVDFMGNAYVTGVADSVDFPTQNALQPNFGGGLNDAFVVKIKEK